MKSSLMVTLALVVSLGAVAEPVEGAQVASVSAAKADAAQWRAVDPARLIVLETTKGRILIEAFPDYAPGHVAQFTKIIRAGDLDNTIFHRVIDDFMAQGGDIESKTGKASPYPDMPGEFVFRRDPLKAPLDAYMGPDDSAPQGFENGFPVRTQAAFLAEMSKDGLVETYLPHCPGTVSTARTDDPNSANSQFFLMRQHSPHLDRKYTAWGRVIQGLDIVRKIKHDPGSPNGEVAAPDVLKSAKIAADMPEASRPVAYVQRTDTAAFKATLEGKGDIDICEIAPVQVAIEK